MLAINAGEWAILALWLVGIAGAVYGTVDVNSTIRRVCLVAVAIFVPVVGSVVGLTFAGMRLWRNRGRGANATTA